MDERVLTALARVFEPSGPRMLSEVVRSDTPLSALGPMDDAWPLLVAALDDLGLHADEAMSPVTVGELERLVLS